MPSMGGARKERYRYRRDPGSLGPNRRSLPGAWPLQTWCENPHRGCCEGCFAWPDFAELAKEGRGRALEPSRKGPGALPTDRRRRYRPLAQDQWLVLPEPATSTLPSLVSGGTSTTRVCKHRWRGQRLADVSVRADTSEPSPRHKHPLPKGTGGPRLHEAITPLDLVRVVCKLSVVANSHPLTRAIAMRRTVNTSRTMP